jgi:hypothetical protein
MDLDVMLCDFAEVAGGKLFISGAGIDRMDLPSEASAPFVANFGIAGLVRVPWSATNSNHRLQFQFMTEDGRTPDLPPGADTGSQGIGGEMQFNVGRPPQATSGQEQLVPIGFNFQGLPLMSTGGYVVILSIDGTEVRRLRFTVSQQQATGYLGRPFG